MAEVFHVLNCDTVVRLSHVYSLQHNIPSKHLNHSDFTSYRTHANDFRTLKIGTHSLQRNKPSPENCRFPISSTSEFHSYLNNNSVTPAVLPYSKRGKQGTAIRKALADQNEQGAILPCHWILTQHVFI